jgi:hypothetical protein
MLQVPVPGASLSGVACVGRWMMGLLALGSCSMQQLVDMYRWDLVDTYFVAFASSNICFVCIAYLKMKPSGRASRQSDFRAVPAACSS